ncbi:MAG: NAD(P)-dependent oxidoreductase [SAR202 cluster bacterium]|nr:NAD(P)-dependent oxidoreductase [SAR202 cluster bacterium]
MRILVTGVTGRIGSNLAAALVQEGHQVRGLVWPRDPRTEKLRPLGLELLEGTITSPEDCKRSVDGVDAVYHLAAAFQGGGPFTVEEYFDINVRGTFNMLEAVRPIANLKHFVVASTDAVLAKYPPGGMKGPVTESTAKTLTGWYGLSKAMVEEMVIGYFRTYKTPTTVLRFPYTVGPGEFLKFGSFYLSSYKARPEAAHLWDGKEKLLIISDENGRPWKKHMASVPDIIHGCMCVLGKTAAAGELFQIGAPSAFSWDDIVPYISKRIEMPYVSASIKTTPTYYEFDLTKARTILGFKPQHDARRMIDEDIAYNKGQSIGVIPV